MLKRVAAERQIRGEETAIMSGFAGPLPDGLTIFSRGPRCEPDLLAAHIEIIY